LPERSNWIDADLTTSQPRQTVPGACVVVMELPILRRGVDALPEGLEGVVCTADLQEGRDEELHEQFCRPPARPLGQLLREELINLSEQRKIRQRNGQVWLFTLL